MPSVLQIFTFLPLNLTFLHFASLSLHLLALGESQCVAADSRCFPFVRWSPTSRSLPDFSIDGLAAGVLVLIFQLLFFVTPSS